MIDIFWFQTIEQADFTLSLQAFLSTTERERSKRFVYDKNRNRYVQSIAALRLLLSPLLRTPAQHLQINRDNNGKPYLSDPGAWNFGLSRSEHHFVIGLSKQAPIAVDISPLKDVTDLPLLAKRCLSMNEQAQFSLWPQHLITPMFHRYWTLKEALLKASGEGLRREPNTLSLQIPNDRFQSYRIQHRNYFTHSRLHQDHALAIVSEKSDTNINIHAADIRLLHKTTEAA